jgi:phage gpG-like protein
MIEAKVTVRMDALMRRVGLAATEIQGELTRAIASWLHLVVRRSFERESTAEGIKWSPLSPKYAARKKIPQILQESGALFEQLNRGPAISGNTITIGSTLPYAAAHQFGFDGEVEVSAHKFLRRVRSNDVWGKLLNPKLGKETRQILATGIHIGDVAKHKRHMKIPARPYLPSKEFVEAEGKAIVEEWAQSTGEKLFGPAANE